MYPSTSAPRQTPDVWRRTSERWRLLVALVALGLIGIAGGLSLNLALVGELAPDEPLLQVAAALVVAMTVQVAVASFAFVTLGRRVGLDAPVLRCGLAGGPW